MANQKIYPRNLLILDRPYLAGFRNEHCEYQASIGDLVAAEIVDFDGENVTRLLTTVEFSRMQFLRPGNGSLHNLYHSAYFGPYFLKSPKKRIIRVCLNRIERMSLLCGELIAKKVQTISSIRQMGDGEGRIGK
jgi:hypothetical protein